MGCAFLLSLSVLMHGAYLIVCDKQREWENNKNKDE